MPRAFKRPAKTFSENVCRGGGCRFLQRRASVEAFPRLEEALFSGAFWRFHWMCPLLRGPEAFVEEQDDDAENAPPPGAASPRCRPGEGAHHTGPVALEFNK